MPDVPAWGQWAWENRDSLKQGISALYRWLWPKAETPADDGGGVLVLGPGGVGKSTLGRILSGRSDPLFDLPGGYDESLDIESYPLKDVPGLEVMVPPGQPHRREATWTEQLENLAQGKFRGIIMMAAYGYHNHEIGTLTSYKDHRLFKGNKDEFLQAFLTDRRAEELKVMRDVAPKITPPSGGKFWMFTLVTKQDLWWEDRAAVDAFYREGEYADQIASIQNRHGGRLFRHELALASLVISNFETGKGEVLHKNTAGYDQKRHAQSLREFLEKLEAIRRWEEGS